MVWSHGGLWGRISSFRLDTRTQRSIGCTRRSMTGRPCSRMGQRLSESVTAARHHPSTRTEFGGPVIDFLLTAFTCRLSRRQLPEDYRPCARRNDQRCHGSSRVGIWSVRGWPLNGTGGEDMVACSPHGSYLIGAAITIRKLYQLSDAARTV